MDRIQHLHELLFCCPLTLLLLCFPLDSLKLLLAILDSIRECGFESLSSLSFFDKSLKRGSTFDPVFADVDWYL